MNNKNLDIVLNILNESNEEKSAESKIILFYSHLIKWKYQPELRRVSLINTIINNCNDIYRICYDNKKKKFKLNIIKNLNDELNILYKYAFKEAIKEMIKLQNKPIYEEEIFHLFSTIYDIIDENKIRSYLEYNSSDEVNEMINKKKRRK